MSGAPRARAPGLHKTLHASVPPPCGSHSQQAAPQHHTQVAVMADQEDAGWTSVSTKAPVRRGGAQGASSRGRGMGRPYPSREYGRDEGSGDNMDMKYLQRWRLARDEIREEQRRALAEGSAGAARGGA